MKVKLFLLTLTLILSLTIIINTILFITYPDWFYKTEKEKNKDISDKFVDSITFVTSILSTVGSVDITPVTNGGKLWVSFLQLIPYILIPIFIAFP